MLAKFFFLLAFLGASLTMAAPMVPQKRGSLGIASAETTAEPATHTALSPMYIAIIVVCSLSVAGTVLVCTIKYCCCRKAKKVQKPAVVKTEQAVNNDATAIPLVARPEACYQGGGSPVPI
ncbi:hypothetical protein F4775DRAFT_556978 [Biscogniauxia sp. FL1348]|nr:hypothetical protein F4775DRAFT_556978 [Biscogniauxia sp. FL1348]